MPPSGPIATSRSGVEQRRLERPIHRDGTLEFPDGGGRNVGSRSDQYDECWPGASWKAIVQAVVLPLRGERARNLQFRSIRG
jgi:hypothetical protein